MLSFKEAFQYFATNFWAKIKSTFLTIEDGINGILLDPKWELVNTVTNNNSITLPSLDTFDELYIEMNNNNADTIVHQVCIKKNSLLSNTGVIYREILLDGIHDTQSYVTYNIATNKITPSYCEGVAISNTSNVTTKVYVKKYVVSENTTTLSSNIISYDNTISDVSANSLQGAINGLNGTVGYEKKNFLNNTASSTVNNGLSFTVNSDKSITVSGTATSDTSFDIILDTEISKGSYLVSGCPSGGSDSNYFMRLKVQYPDGLGLANRYVYNYGEDAPFICNKDNTHITAQIYIANTTTINKTFYPMIRYSSITDDTYEPYVDDVDTRFDNVDRKFTLVNNDISNVNTKVDRLYGVEKIDFLQTFTTPNHEYTYYNYTASKRCIIHLNCIAHCDNSSVIYAKIAQNYVEKALFWDDSHPSAVSLSTSVILEKGDWIEFSAHYVDGDTQNRIRVTGYIQYLE